MADTQPPSRPGRIQRPAIFVCDIQDKLRNAIHEFDKVVLTTKKVLRAAETLQVPVYVTTQNRARLGGTVAELAPHLGAAVEDADKTRFSMWIPELARHFDRARPAEVVLVGIESHICVTQTALDALAAGHRVYVLADGVSSCNPQEVPVALARLRAEGAVVTSSESFLYELMADAAIPEFKAIAGLVKETSQDTKAAMGALLSKI